MPDVIVAAYSLWVALLVVACRGEVPGAAALVAVHLVIAALPALLPPRRRAPAEGAAAEPGDGARVRSDGAAGRARGAVTAFVRFLRWAYPLPLMLFFFEEVALTVNAVFPATPYWFEPWLYAADEALFGTLPVVALAPWAPTPLGEVMHAFYFSYYLILVGGLALAWRPPAGGPAPSPAFQPTLTAMTGAFVLSFLPYPFLAARGPWENPELMAALPPFQGPVFTPLMERIIEHGAVSGGCFPSAHVSAAWGTVLGLLVGGRRRAGLALAPVAAGMSFACVFTRYHHAVDIFAGLACAAGGGLVAWLSHGEPASGGGR